MKSILFVALTILFSTVFSNKFVLAETGKNKENEDCSKTQLNRKNIDSKISIPNSESTCLETNSFNGFHGLKLASAVKNANFGVNYIERSIFKSEEPKTEKKNIYIKGEALSQLVKNSQVSDLLSPYQSFRSESVTESNIRINERKSKTDPLASENTQIPKNSTSLPYERFETPTVSPESMVVKNNSFSINIPKSTLAISQPDDSMRKPVGFSDLDFSTPSSPGARMIGIRGDIGSVSTPNELAVKLLNGLSSDGSFQPGVAIDIAPYLLASGPSFTLADYRKDGFQRFLANTKISIATASSDQGANLGLGAEFILLNDGDPRFDDQLFKDLREATEPPNPLPTTFDPEVFNNSIKSKIIEAKKRAKIRSEGKETWVLGIGTSLVSSSNRYYDFRGNGMGIWTTYKRGMGVGSELILHGEYRSKEKTSDRNGGFVNVDTAIAGVRLRTGDDKFKFSLETAYNYASQEGAASNSYLSLGLGAEPKITDDLWLSLSLAGNIGRQNGNDVQVFSGLKWNFNSGK